MNRHDEPGSDVTGLRLRLQVPLNMPDSGLIAATFDGAQTCIANDYRRDERTKLWHAHASERHIRAAAAMPLQQHGRTVGVLLFVSDQRNVFDEALVSLLERMTENLSFALDNFAREAERRRSERALRNSEARFRQLTELSSDWYWELDSQYRFVRLEGRHDEDAESLEGDAPLGKRRWETGLQVVDGGTWDAHREQLSAHEAFRELVLTRPMSDRTLRYISISGEPLFDEHGAFTGYRGIGRNITESRVAEERIQYLATHDGLTGLPNRLMFSQTLNVALNYARRYQHKLAVLFIDIDRFKLINDTLGHEAGDDLLRAMARRLRESVRSSDVVARLGGDEFVVLLQEVGTPADASRVASSLLNKITHPIETGGQECRVTASIGISVYPRDAEDEQALMKYADLAMYAVKDDGKNNYQFYVRGIRARTLERMMLETALRRAMEHESFELHYQAQLDLNHMHINGVEALLRMHDPEHGEIPPSAFIPVAEETGMIVPIGRWVLQKACEQQVAWHRQGLRSVCIAVNLSARQFNDPNLLQDVANALQSSGMEPEMLEMELTEGMVIQNPERAVRVLTALRAMKVKIAIDDFGVGFSSLAQIKRFPIDALKVDRSFIRNLPDNRADRAITEAISAIALTRSTGPQARSSWIRIHSHKCSDGVDVFYGHAWVRR